MGSIRFSCCFESRNTETMLISRMSGSSPGALASKLHMQVEEIDRLWNIGEEYMEEKEQSRETDLEKKKDLERGGASLPQHSSFCPDHISLQ